MTELDQLDDDIELLSEELKRLKARRNELRNEFVLQHGLELLVKKHTIYQGITARDLPNPLTEEEFQAYLDIKQEEKPGDRFFSNEQGVRDWLAAKNIAILKSLV